MEIFLNGTKVELYPYDDIFSVIERYSKDQPGMIPSYFRLTDRVDRLEKGKKIKISDIITEISGKNGNQITNIIELNRLKALYPALNSATILILWAINKKGGLNNTDYSYLNGTRMNIFATKNSTDQAIKDYQEKIVSVINGIKDRVEKQLVIFKELNEIKSTITATEFIEERIDNSYVLSVTNGENLLDIFDNIRVSLYVPFVSVNFAGKTFYKIYSHLIPANGWISEIEYSQGIRMYVLNTTEDKVISKKYLLENIYSTAFWDTNNVLTASFKTRGDISEDIFLSRISEAVQTKYETTEVRKMGIKGTFDMTFPRFNRLIISDLTMTNKLFRYFLFMNERKKTALHKPRFYLYFNPSQNGDVNDSLTLTVINTDETHINIRVAFAIDIQQAIACRNVLTKLFSIADKEYPNILKYYGKFIDNIDAIAGIKRSKTEQQDDKKTGKRAKLLRDFDPDMFGTGYPSSCFRKRQPYIINSFEQATKLAKTLNEPHKVIEFQGVWYACQPREDDDADKDHVWPGLVKNKSNIEEYKKKYPLLPCCFTTDQYTKATSLWKDALFGNKEKQDVGKSDGIGHIIAPNKVLPVERFGDLPYNLQRLMTLSNITKINKGKLTLFPYLRYGVADTPDSFIQCIEQAVNSAWKGAPEKNKRERIKQIKDRLLKQFNYSKQELYDYDLVTIKNLLENENYYVEPEMFVTAASELYKLNIILFQIDENNPSGNILLPRHSVSCILRKQNPTRDTIVIIKHDSPNSASPYICELMCKISIEQGKLTKINFKFSRDNFVDSLASLSGWSNTTFVIDREGGYAKISE